MKLFFTTVYTILITNIYSQSPACFTLPYGTVGKNPTGSAVNDFNNDGKLDVVTVNRYDNSLSFCAGNGDGTFNNAVTTMGPANSGLIAIANSDFNGDGKLDIVTANENSNKISIFFGNGLGSFTLSASYNVGAQPRFVVAEDFNSDGIADVVTSNPYANSISLFINSGTGTFSTALTTMIGQGPSTIICKDVNNDQKKDLLVSTYFSDSRVSVLISTGSGSFNAPSHYPGGGAGYNSFVIGDYNEDGNEDLITSTCGMLSAIPNRLLYYSGTGNGTFNSAVTFTVNDADMIGTPCVTALASGDFNGSHIISGDNYLCKKSSYRKEFYRSSISNGTVGLL